ncbi:hypothetical protein [Propionivibrio sp.]|uniref:hypothetical protein n=1 Tax=Propionivibrio sp. TaxID=2212460 RepID=UPI003BEF6F9E
MAYRTQLEVSEGLAAVVDMCLGHYLPEGRNPHREAAQAALDEYNAISHTGPELSDSKLDHEATCDVGGRPEAGSSILANAQADL